MGGLRRPGAVPEAGIAGPAAVDVGHVQRVAEGDIGEAREGAEVGVGRKPLIEDANPGLRPTAAGEVQHPPGLGHAGVEAGGGEGAASAVEDRPRERVGAVAGGRREARGEGRLEARPAGDVGPAANPVEAGVEVPVDHRVRRRRHRAEPGLRGDAEIELVALILEDRAEIPLEHTGVGQRRIDLDEVLRAVRGRAGRGRLRGLLAGRGDPGDDSLVLPEERGHSVDVVARDDDFVLDHVRRAGR